MWCDENYDPEKKKDNVNVLCLLAFFAFACGFSAAGNTFLGFLKPYKVLKTQPKFCLLESSTRPCNNTSLS